MNTGDRNEFLDYCALLDSFARPSTWTYVDPWTPTSDRSVYLAHDYRKKVLGCLLKLVRKAEQQRTGVTPFDVRELARVSGDSDQTWLVRCLDALERHVDLLVSPADVPRPSRAFHSPLPRPRQAVR